MVHISHPWQFVDVLMATLRAVLFSVVLYGLYFYFMDTCSFLCVFHNQLNITKVE